MNMSSQIHILAVLPAACRVGRSLWIIRTWDPISLRSVPVQTQMYQVRYLTFYRVSENFRLFFLLKCTDKKGAAMYRKLEIPIHKTLQMIYVTSVTRPWESLSPFSVAGNTVHSPSLPLRPTSYFLLLHREFSLTLCFLKTYFYVTPLRLRVPNRAASFISNYEMALQARERYDSVTSQHCRWPQKKVLKGPWASLHEAEAFGTLESKGSKLRTFRHDEVAPKIVGIPTWKCLVMGKIGEGKGGARCRINTNFSVGNQVVSFDRSYPVSLYNMIT
jgi:hypothetical protein